MLSNLHKKKVKVVFKYMTRLSNGDVSEAVKTLVIADISHLLAYGRFIIPGNYVVEDDKLFKKVSIEKRKFFVDSYITENEFDRLSKSDLEFIDKALVMDYKELTEKALKNFEDKDEYNELDIINALLEGEEREGMYQYVKEHLDIQKYLDNI